MIMSLWVAQAFLGLVFLVTGTFKVFFYEKSREHLKIAQVATKQMIITIGVLETLGALGVILPAATGILPWLTPTAAIGLALTMIVALRFNIKNDEVLHIPLNIILLAAAIFVGYSRFVIAPL